MKTFRPARKRIDVSVGESVRIIRELQGYSQNELAKLSGIPQATLSAIENDRVRLGVERAKVLGRALRCHPAVLVAAYGIVAQSSMLSCGFRLRNAPNISSATVTVERKIAFRFLEANCSTIRTLRPRSNSIAKSVSSR